MVKESVQGLRAEFAEGLIVFGEHSEQIIMDGKTKIAPLAVNRQFCAYGYYMSAGLSSRVR